MDQRFNLRESREDLLVILQIRPLKKVIMW